MKKLNVIIGILISLICLILAFWKVNPTDVIAGFKKADFIFILPMIIVILLYCIVRTYRWRLIFKPHPLPGFKNLFSSIMIGIMTNNIMPAKVGEIARAFIIGKKEKLGISLSFGTIIIERLFDFLALFFCLFVLFFISTKEKAFIWNLASTGSKVAFYTTLLSILLLLAGLILFKLKTDFFIKILGKFTRIKHWLNLFAEGLKSIDDFKNALNIFLLSVICWVLQGGIMFIGLKAFDISIGFASSFLVLIVLALGMVIPPSPGGIGPTQLISVIALGFYGVSQSDALSFSIIFNFVSFIVTTLIGWYFFLKESINFNELLRIKKEEI